MTVLERATGNINQAIGLQGVTADLAAAKNIDLSSAAAVVGKVFGGQETALRRAVPGLSKHAHGLDLIRLASQKLAGQAAANTTASQRFAATLHDTQVTIGTLLLPSLDKLLGKLTKVGEKLNKFSDESKKPGTDANKQVSNIRALGSAFGFLAGKVDKAAGSLGGWTRFAPRRQPGHRARRPARRCGYRRRRWRSRPRSRHRTPGSGRRTWPPSPPPRQPKPRPSRNATSGSTR